MDIKPFWQDYKKVKQLLDEIGFSDLDPKSKEYKLMSHTLIEIYGQEAYDDGLI